MSTNISEAPEQDSNRIPGDFIPDLCTVTSVLMLVVVGELLSLALVMYGHGLYPFAWEKLGMVSFIVQWIVLVSAGILCILRPKLKVLSPVEAGALSYTLVLLVALVFTLLGQAVLAKGQLNKWQVVENLFITAIFAGVVLRALYLQQQLNNQQKSELNSRIQALQARIRPHFLFNSMNSIASLIAIDPQKAEQLVEDLSELFRASLAEPTLVSITGELDLCKRYVAIEQLRLGERLQVDWQIKEYPSYARIPSMLLQPLIENAIYHGIQPLADGGKVELQVWEDNGFLEIMIRNPVGEEDVEQKPGNRMALSNIRHRLLAHFGSSASCETTIEDKHFIIRIRYGIE